jgi:ATP-dependent DNA helicase RecG
MLKIADIEQDGDLLAAARRIAERILAEQPEVAERHLQRWLAGAEQLLKV